MSIKEKLFENAGQQPAFDPNNATYEQIQEMMKAIPGTKKVEIAFKQSAGTYWGKIGKVRVLETKQTEKGTKYFLVIADIIKEGEKLKLLQEWFVGQDGIAKPALKKNITIPEEYATEVSLLLDEEFEVKD